MMEDEPWWHESQSQSQAQSESGPESAEEAAKLFAALRDRVLSDPAAMRAGLGMLDLLKGLSGSASHPVSPGEARECAYCPVCLAISRAQNISPETLDTVTSAALQFAETVKEAVAESNSRAKPDTVRTVPLNDTF